jgi:putative chitinase
VPIPLSTDDWQRALMELGVEAEVATARAPSFAATIKESTFSAGLAKELPDFMATILHESAYLAKLKENGNYSARRIKELAINSPAGSRWRSLLPRAEKLGGNPDAFFEALYGGRMGNGPEGSGDGARYPGRAYIGVTGKSAYIWLRDHCGQDVDVTPELAEEPTFGLEFTISWWEGHVPDWVLGDERKVRKIVNGGYFGLDEVERLYKLCVEVFA